jgi:hypothetical protein
LGAPEPAAVGPPEFRPVNRPRSSCYAHTSSWTPLRPPPPRGTTTLPTPSRAVTIPEHVSWVCGPAAQTESSPQVPRRRTPAFDRALDEDGCDTQEPAHNRARKDPAPSKPSLIEGRAEIGKDAPRSSKPQSRRPRRFIVDFLLLTGGTRFWGPAGWIGCGTCGGRGGRRGCSRRWR